MQGRAFFHLKVFNPFVELTGEWHHMVDGAATLEMRHVGL
jgi:hypothetical protein